MGNGKNLKKVRQYVRRNEKVLVSESWKVFFEVISQMKFTKRLKIAWLIIKGYNLDEVKKVKDGTENSGDSAVSGKD